MCVDKFKRKFSIVKFVRNLDYVFRTLDCFVVVVALGKVDTDIRLKQALDVEIVK